MKPLVSVIILSYKNIQGIYESLDSVLKQTYERIEVVISDDGSPDFAKELDNIVSYVENHKRPNLMGFVMNAIPVNGGTVKNINSAIQKCSGELIKVLSAEDTLKDENSLAIYVDFMMANEYLIVFGKMRGVTPDGEYKYKLLSCESDYDLLKSYTVADTRNRLFARNFLPAPAWMAKKELFEQFGLFPETVRLIEDYPYWLHLTQNNVLFGYIDEILIEYKLSGVSSAGSYSEMFMNDMFVIYDKYIFPYDKRFGICQKLYNVLKRKGLEFYMAEARWGKMSKAERIKARIVYFPFWLFVTLQNMKVNMQNKAITRG